MKKFVDLTKAQKTFIVRFLDVCPELRTSTNVIYKDIIRGYMLLKEQRASTGEKLGFPLWLQKTNLVGRGTYEFPWPTDEELSAFANVKLVPLAKSAKTPKAPKVKASANSNRLQKIVDKSSVQVKDIESFNEILRANGIEV